MKSHGRLILPPPYCPRHPMVQMVFIFYDEEHHADEYACNVCGWVTVRDR